MDETVSYFHKESGEILTFTDEIMQIAEGNAPPEDRPQWLQDAVSEALEFLRKEEEYIPLPTQFDIHEYAIMERFCRSIEDRDKSRVLYRAIKGRGAFRMFKDKIRALGLVDDWYRYRAEALAEHARRWCIGNDVEYHEDS